MASKAFKEFMALGEVAIINMNDDDVRQYAKEHVRDGLRPSEAKSLLKLAVMKRLAMLMMSSFKLGADAAASDRIEFAKRLASTSYVRRIWRDATLDERKHAEMTILALIHTYETFWLEPNEKIDAIEGLLSLIVGTVGEGLSKSREGSGGDFSDLLKQAESLMKDGDPDAKA